MLSAALSPGRLPLVTQKSELSTFFVRSTQEAKQENRTIRFLEELSTEIVFYEKTREKSESGNKDSKISEMLFSLFEDFVAKVCET